MPNTLEPNFSEQMVQMSVHDCKIVCVNCSFVSMCWGNAPLLVSGTNVCAVSLTFKLTDCLSVCLSLFSAKEEEDEVDGVVNFQCYRNFRVRLDCRSVDLTGKLWLQPHPHQLRLPKKAEGNRK